MKLVCAISLTALLAVGCFTDADSTVRSAEAAGLTDVVPGSYSVFACSKDDFTSTKFTAKNQAGTTVHGVVCCGLLKSCTVRFN